MSEPVDYVEAMLSGIKRVLLVTKGELTWNGENWVLVLGERKWIYPTLEELAREVIDSALLEFRGES